MTPSDKKTDKTPEEFFSDLVKEQGRQLSDSDLRLLLSGLQALREARAKTLNDNERKAVQGLIDCVAYEQKLSTETVAACVTTNFNVETINAIPSAKYHDVIAFLIDLQERILLN